MNVPEDFVARWSVLPPSLRGLSPWALTDSSASSVQEIIASFAPDSGIAVHSTASVSPTAFIEAPAVVGPGAFVSHHAVIRSGVWLDENVFIGPGCEIKSSFIFGGTRIAHLNYVGNSVIGSDVNLEAGAVIANHWNERQDKAITVVLDGERVPTNVSKFGALVGDGVRVGANAVTSPGTILMPRDVVGRLQLVDQSG